MPRIWKIKDSRGDLEIYGLLYSGLFDKNKKEICEGDSVRLYYKGQFVICEIIYKDGLFCLKWPDGYINNYMLTPSNLEIVDPKTQQI